MVAPKPKLLFANEGKWFDLLAPAFCIVYFLLLAGNGLNAFFSGDDIQNLVRLHDCFHTPLLEIAQQALTVVSGAYRPVGGLFYRSIYAVFGFDPLPFRTAAFALMGVNLLLAYRLARILSASRYAALAATFLLSCNASFVEMYHSTGMIYDILCFGFFAGAFLIYAAVRSRGSHLGKGRICCVFILYCLALGSKEIAVAFPAALLLYELVYHPHQFRRRDILASLRKSHFGAIAGLAVLTAAYAAVKLLAGTHIATDATYKLEISFGAFAASLDHYLPQWLYLGDIDEPATLAIAAGAGIAAYALRAKALMFGVSLMIATFLPVAFIPPRGTFAFYLPSLGCALFLGSAASLASEKLLSLRLFDRADSIASRRRRNRIKAALQGIGFLVFAAFATPAHHTRLTNSPIYSYPLYSYLEQSRDILLPDLKAMHPNLPKGATIYFEDDPYPKNLFSIVALIRLAYDDPTLRIDRRKVTGRPSLPYDFAFTFARGRVEPFPLPLPAPVPARLAGYAAPAVPALQPEEIVSREEAAQLFFQPEIVSREDVAQLFFQPEIAKPGQEVAVQAERFAGKTIDVYWKHSFPDGRPVDFGVAPEWCAVDADGVCTVSLPPDFPRSRIEILYARGAAGQSGGWHTARGSLDVR